MRGMGKKVKRTGLKLLQFALIALLELFSFSQKWCKSSIEKNLEAKILNHIIA
jgi:hypothetical protein